MSNWSTKLTELSEFDNKFIIIRTGHKLVSDYEGYSLGKISLGEIEIIDNTSGKLFVKSWMLIPDQ